MDTARKIMRGLVVVVLLGVAAWGVCSYYFQPKLVAERELEMLAQDYYENYYYDKIAAENDDMAATLGEYAESGLPSVKLRQLLLFDNQRHADSAEVFKAEGYTCDTNTTAVKYFPAEPYGKTDYRVEYTLRCEE